MRWGVLGIMQYIMNNMQYNESDITSFFGESVIEEKKGEGV